jgi:hypothetical protein
MRQFIRHPTGIPIEVCNSEQRKYTKKHIYNVSLGGLAFDFDQPMPLGKIVSIKISYVQPVFETKARVVWCSKQEEGYELGVEFLDAEDAFKGRMVEQVCYIENYKNDVLRTEGRRLTIEEAAQEWITKFASNFPDFGISHN